MNHIQTASHNRRTIYTGTALDRLSWLLDAAFAIPGTRWRIGLDGLLGLIPGVGDTIGAALSSYIIYVAARQGASKRTLLKMIGNVLLEAVVGLVPILGDIFDIAWRANIRNVELLRTELPNVVHTERSSKQVALLFAATAGIIIVFFLGLSLVLLQSLYRLIVAA